MYLWGHSTEGLPDEVRIPSEIGVGLYCHENGIPCCGMGHIYFSISGNSRPFSKHGSGVILLEKLYLRALSLCGVRGSAAHTATYMNDQANPQQRMDAYYATWSAAGYNLVGFDKKDRDRITRLARKVKKWMNEWIAPGVPRS